MHLATSKAILVSDDPASAGPENPICILCVFPLRRLVPRFVAMSVHAVKSKKKFRITRAFDLKLWGVEADGIRHWTRLAVCVRVCGPGRGDGRHAGPAAAGDRAKASE